MQITVFQQNVKAVNGLTTFDRVFLQKLSEYYDIEYIYRVGDSSIIESFKKYATVVKEDGKVHETDICVFSSLEHGSPRPIIRAKKYIQVVHSDPRNWDREFKADPLINVYVAVGEDVKKILKERYEIDAIVIENMIGDYEEEKVLRLITASRIAEYKGFERVVKLAKLLKIAGKPFIWEIHGEGSVEYINKLKYDLSLVPEVSFVGAHKNIQNYIKGNDYLVQLSDHEGFCYSIHEALQVGVPCIVTNWPNVDKVIKNGENGYILDMDLQTVELNKLYNHIPKSVTLKLYKTIEKWFNIF